MEFDASAFAALIVAAAFFALLAVLKRRFQWGFGARVLLATGLGVVLGLAFGGSYTYYALVGTIYANVISAMVVPLLFFSIIASITNLSDLVHIKAIGWKSVLFLLLNTLTATLLTLLIALPLHIGQGFSLDAVSYDAKTVPSVTDTIVGLFPQNLATSWTNNAVVPIIVFALIVAAAYNRLVQKQKEAPSEKAVDVKPFKAFVDATNSVLGNAVSWIVSFTPYAVVSLIGRAVGRADVATLLPLVGVLVVAYVILAIQFFGVESAFVAFIGKLNPARFFRGIAPAAVTAFTTQSSVGTIPVTVSSLTKNLGVDEDVASFTAGLGANLGMPGCAGMWPTLVALFALNATGTVFTPGQYVLLVLLTLVVSIGTVGVPGTATITATALLAALGLPVETIALVAPISSIVDMGRTATNVVGAAEASLIVARTESLVDEGVYNGGEAYHLPSNKKAEAAA